MTFGPIDAILFDMDGTLVDSEPFTDRVVVELLQGFGLDPGGLDLRTYHGVTWEAIEADLQRRFPALAGRPLRPQLEARFHALFLQEPPTYIPGADAFLAAVCDRGPAAIVTSSTRDCADALVRRLGLGERLGTLVAAGDYRGSKPEPACFLLAAQQLGCAPERCLVFEDSVPGLRAARNANMARIGVASDPAQRHALADVADRVIDDYHALPDDFLVNFGR